MILGKPLVSLKLRSSEMKSDASFSSNCDFSELLLNFIREGKTTHLVWFHRVSYTWILVHLPSSRYMILPFKEHLTE